jgi:hypothetical protein
MQREYARLDGYGHHFNPYDGGQKELDLSEITENMDIKYYVFRTN